MKPILSAVCTAICLASLTATPAAAAPATGTEALAWTQPFAEITELQTEKIKQGGQQSNSKTTATLSLPYTRVDLLLRNGIAFTRIVQMYHNQSKENQGYTFSLPTSIDSHISSFAIWDRGKRLVGSIEERTKAEETYREITGDETPSMDIDPGLLRKSLNRFEMRIFPIYPGENKQIALSTHERIPFQNGTFRYKLPLEALLASDDPRHPGIESQTTEVFLHVEDELTLGKIHFTGHRPQQIQQSPHAARYKLVLSPDQIANLEVSYSIALPEQTAASLLTFEDAGEQFFVMRIFAAIDSEQVKGELKKFKEENATVMKMLQAIRGDAPPHRPPAAPKNTSPFYIAVWQGEHSVKSLDSIANLELELLGYQAFQLMDQDQFFHASWLTPFKFGGRQQAGRFHLIRSRAPYPVSQWLIPFSQEMKEIDPRNGLPKQDKTRAAGTGYQEQLRNSIEHLRTALQKDKSELIYLFLDDIGAQGFSELHSLVQQYAEATFVLVTKEPLVPAALLSEKNINSYTLREGWQRNRHFIAQHQILPDMISRQMFAAIGIVQHGAALQPLLNSLPNLDEGVPRWHANGTVQFSDVMMFLPSTMQGEYDSANVFDETHRLLWLSGRYQGSGNTVLQITFPSTIPSSDFMIPGSAGTPKSSATVTLAVPKADSSLRFVGSFYGSSIASELDAQIRMLRGWRAEQPQLHDNQRLERLKALRKEVVQLSRRFSFISNETAFIALPENLREQHDIPAQRYEFGELYGTAAGSQTDIAVVPEPGSFLLLAIVLSALLLLRMASHCSYRSQCAPSKRLSHPNSVPGRQDFLHSNSVRRKLH